MCDKTSSILLVHKTGLFALKY